MHLLVPRSRSSAKVKFKYKGYISQKMAVSGAFVFHKHVLFHNVFKSLCFRVFKSQDCLGMCGKQFIFFFFCRETHTIEENAESLVKLLEVCHTHNLKPSPKESDPPHAKIASDIMSCLFMVRTCITHYHTMPHFEALKI